MTLKKFFIEELGKDTVKALPREWQEHIRRVDALPKPLHPAKQVPPEAAKQD